MNTIKKKDYFWMNENKEKQQNYLNKKFELIREIENEKMNHECFDCRKKDPQYISINNAIFLCDDCAQIHKSFPDNISFIIDNDLNLLTSTFLKYLYYGGNANLDNFINYDYPGLQNYTPEILYRTQAMIYYREELKCKIELKPKPIRPNNIMAYKLVSENGLINIREGNKYKSKKISENKILKKDIINNYYNNFNNTYNTYNNFSLNNKDNNDNFGIHQNIKMDKKIKRCSLVNKAFFNEMKNLFGKASSLHNSNNKKMEVFNSYSNASKTKNKFKNYSLTNRIDPCINQSLTYRINESFNYSLTNRSSVNEILSFNKMNKSTFSDEKIKSVRRCNNSRRYIKPKVKIPQSKISHQKKHIVNKLSIEKDILKKKKLTIDLSQITRYNDTSNSLKLNKNIYKQKKKIFNFFKIKKNEKKLKDINNEINNNLSFDSNDNNESQKEMLLNKINKNMKPYLYTEYIKNIRNINNQAYLQNYRNTEENQTEVNNYNNNMVLDLQNISNINSYKKKDINSITSKKKNKELNISYDNGNQRKPIKVNLSMTSSKNNNNSLINKKYDDEIKKKALQDKKEQEELEQEALHNLLFEKKDNDLFTNIIYLNNNNQ